MHGRTVKEMYRSAVHYDFIARAVDEAGCPVLANGNVYSAAKAESVLEETGARGLMIGRGIIRNPWLFTQIHRHLRDEPPAWPSGREVLEYVADLFEMTAPENYIERSQVQKMKTEKGVVLGKMRGSSPISLMALVHAQAVVGP